MPGITDEPEPEAETRAPRRAAPRHVEPVTSVAPVTPERQRLVIDVSTGEPEKGVTDPVAPPAVNVTAPQAAASELEPMQEPELVDEGFLLEPDMSDEPMVESISDPLPEDK